VLHVVIHRVGCHHKALSDLFHRETARKQPEHLDFTLRKASGSVSSPATWLLASCLQDAPDPVAVEDARVRFALQDVSRLFNGHRGAVRTGLGHCSDGVGRSENARRLRQRAGVRTAVVTGPIESLVVQARQRTDWL
jgi:hypothetical protein